MNSMAFRWLLPVGLLLAVPYGQAQTDQPALANSSMLEYRSVFADFQKFSDHPINSWQITNSTVGAFGGWRAYAEEVSESNAQSEDAASNADGEIEKIDPLQNTQESHGQHGGKP